MVPPQVHDSPPTWRPATRVAFRFSFVYFGTYILTMPILPALIALPAGEMPELGTLPPIRTVVSWVAKHVFGITIPLVVTGSGSGDKTFDWVEHSCLLVLALTATLVWSLLDRRRKSYPDLCQWFRVFVRFALGATMVAYGAMKVVPLQMGYGPSLTRLVEPFGNFSPMGVLWTFVGASPAYEIFAGCAELAGGILVFLPQTTTLGLLICLMDAVHVFVLNMAYDVPVKLFSFHLIMLSLVLLAPDAKRLANVFLFNRPADPSPDPPLARSARGRRIALATQIALGAYLVSVNFYSASRQWVEYGGGAARSPLHGIWKVNEMWIDGQAEEVPSADDRRWQRVIFDTPRAMFQRMDGSFAPYLADIDSVAASLTLTRGEEGSEKATFSFHRRVRDLLVLDGAMDGHKVLLHLQLVDRQQFQLVNRGFHWIQEYPFNR